MGDVQLSGNIGIDSKGYFFKATTETVIKDGTNPDGTSISVRGAFTVEIRLGPDMVLVLKTYLSWQFLKKMTLEWLETSPESRAKVNWEQVATGAAGVLTVATALVLMKSAATTAAAATAAALEAFFLGIAGVMTGALFMIDPKYTNPNYFDPNHPPST